MDHKSIFTTIYENCVWGNNNNNKYNGSSGGGSDISFNAQNYIPFLKSFIVENGIKTIVDLGCGDFKCGKLLYDDISGIKYYGYDAYDAYDRVIDSLKISESDPKYSFTNIDIVNNIEEIKSGDLCILKDILQHWCNKDICLLLDNLTCNKKFKYIIIVNCCNQKYDNEDTTTGGGRPLSCKYYPIKKYNPVKLFNYNSKEVSLISI
jgi:hypothetical protein